MKPLDAQQQDLIEILKTAHRTLAIARKTRASEVNRRVAEAKRRIEGELDRATARIKIEVDAELAFHEIALDEALIATYDAEISVRKIAAEGFGNRYDGGVQQLLVKLRADDRVGSRKGWRNEQEGLISTARFPGPVDVASLVSESDVVAEPTFAVRSEPLVLVPASNDNDEISVTAVILEFDPRDPWFASIAENARVGSPYLRATFCTLYVHPATGNLVAFESRETGEETYDHPIARYVKIYEKEVRVGFDRAIAEASE